MHLLQVAARKGCGDVAITALRIVFVWGALPPVAFGDRPRSIFEAKMGWSILGKRVAVEHEALEAFVKDMGVDLGRGDIGMAQKHLDRA